MRLSLPFLGGVPNPFLGRVIVGQGQRHQLIEIDFTRPIKVEQSRCDVGELEPLAHSRWGNAESGRDLLAPQATRNKLLKSHKLVSGMHSLPNSVFGQTAL